MPRWYVDGKRVLETSSIADLAAQRGSAGFAWLGLRMPTDSELDEAAKVFDIPDLAIADARHKHERPKVERHGDCLLTVVPTARYVDAREEVEFGELFFYVGDDYVVTVRYGQAAPLKDVRAELEQHPDVLRHGPGAVLQAALLHAVAGLHTRGRRSRERRSRGRARRVQRVTRAADPTDLLPDPRGDRLPDRPRAAAAGDQAADRAGVHPMGRSGDRPVVQGRRGGARRGSSNGAARFTHCSPTPWPPATRRRRCVRTRTRGGSRHGSPSAWCRLSSAACSE